MRGALRYAASRDELFLNLPEGEISIPMQGKTVRGLIVLNEMFDYNFRDYSTPVLALAHETGVSVVVMDYGALHVLALNLHRPERFLHALDEIFTVAVTNEEFPRSRYLGPPTE